MARLHISEASQHQYQQSMRVKSEGYEALLKEVRNQIAANEQLLAIKNSPAGLEQMKKLVEQVVGNRKELLNVQERMNRASIIKRIMDEVAGYGPIQDLLTESEVTEIMVYGANKIRYEKEGLLHDDETIRFRDEQHLMDIIEIILRDLNIEISPSNPEANARLRDGSRVHVLIKPVALDGPYVTIRKFRPALGIDELLNKYQMLTPELVEYYQMMMQLSKSFIISGGTGAGKTSHLNAVSSFIPDHFDIVTIEDVAELQLQQPHVRRIETIQETTDSKLNYEIADGVKSGLRMNPSILIIGEARDGKALFSVLKAMNTGHEGSASTIHANNVRDCFDRMMNMVLEEYSNLSEKAVIRSIRSSIQWVVQIKKDYLTGRRYVSEVAELEGLDESGEIKVRPIFTYNPATQQTEFTGQPSQYIEEAKSRGIRVPSVFERRERAC